MKLCRKCVVLLTTLFFVFSMFPPYFAEAANLTLVPTGELITSVGVGRHVYNKIIYVYQVESIEESSTDYTLQVSLIHTASTGAVTPSHGEVTLPSNTVLYFTPVKAASTSVVVSDLSYIYVTGEASVLQYHSDWGATGDTLSHYFVTSVYTAAVQVASKVVFDVDGVPTTTSQTPGNALTIPSDPTKTGHTFKGWYTSASAGTQVTASTVVPSTDTTYYAQWTINSSTLTVNPNGGTWSNSTTAKSYTQNYNTTLSIPKPTRTGYTFSKWTKSGTNGTLSSTTAAATYTFGPTKGVTDTITANWTPNTYTVTWDTGTGVSTTSQTYNTTLTLPSLPTKANAYFDGWWTAPTDGIRVTASTVYQTASNTTYYAHWIQTFSVTVPATLPVSISPDGQVRTTTPTITNNSTGAVKCVSVTLTAKNGWTIVPSSTNMSRVKVNSKQIAFTVQDIGTIAEGSTDSVRYSASISPTSTAYTNEQAISVIFVFDWATS